MSWPYGAMIITPYEPRWRDDTARTWRDSVLSWGFKGWEPPTPDQFSGFVDRLAVSDKVTHLAIEDDRLLGFISIAPDGHVDHLYVAADAQGQGVGASLIAFAKNAHPGGLALMVAAPNVRGQKFYQREGFRQVETPPEHPDPRFRRYRYCWP